MEKGEITKQLLLETTKADNTNAEKERGCLALPKEEGVSQMAADTSRTSIEKEKKVQTKKTLKG